MTTLRMIAAVVVLGALAGAAAVTVGSALWNRETERLRERLLRGVGRPRAPGSPPREDVPAPVARFLSRSLPSSGGRILSARIVEEGRFQMGEGASGWRRFRADHDFRAYPPGFVWDARIAMAPLLTVRVRDFYLDGQAGMLAKVASVFTVANAAGTSELGAGALYRFLAEAPWIPSRLLPGEGLTWRAGDDTTAHATLEADGHRIELRFRFTPEGDVHEIFTPARPKEVDGRYEDAAWVGRFWAHEEVHGFRVPREGEVAWVTDGTEAPYWRGRLTSLDFELED